MATANLKTIFNIPNSIGYLRIILLYASTFFSTTTFITLYSISALLDFFDGKMARRYNQCTFLGSCLDMITDRSATALIFAKIAALEPSMLSFLHVTLLTDVLSHFLYFSYAISSKAHHKNPDNCVLRMYYDKRVLMVLCTGSEMFFVGLVLQSVYGCLRWFVYVLGVLSVIKSFFHVVQMYVALCGLSLHEDKNK
ncbi:hypothetical protein COBT_002842, partial [Conglomerata obtusa]